MRLTLTDHSALAFLAEASAGFAATVEVARAVGITNPACRNLLKRLARDGLVAPVAGSARTYLYWVTPAGRKAIAA